MKTKFVALFCSLAIFFGNVDQVSADTKDGAAIIADVVVARPVCFAATVIGSAFFVVALPFAAISDSIDSSAEALVKKPARATFTRPLGDFDALRD